MICGRHNLIQLVITLKILLDSIGSLFCWDRGCHCAVEAALFCESINLIAELFKAYHIVVADLQRRINIYIGNVMVTCKYTRDETEQGLSVANAVLVGIYKTSGMLDVVGKLCTLFDAYYRTLRLFGSGIDHFNEMLGLACTLNADD